MPDTGEREAYERLQVYSLEHGDPGFIHQLVVDAWTAQHADADTRAIALTFALIGLHLHVDRGFTGHQVQRVHMVLARRRRNWPKFPLPEDRGSITAREVLAAEPGEARDRTIGHWCESVWAAYSDSHEAVVTLLAEHDVRPGARKRRTP